MFQLKLKFFENSSSKTVLSHQLKDLFFLTKFVLFEGIKLDKESVSEKKIVVCSVVVSDWSWTAETGEEKWRKQCLKKLLKEEKKWLNQNDWKKLAKKQENGSLCFWIRYYKIQLNCFFLSSPTNR